MTLPSRSISANPSGPGLRTRKGDSKALAVWTGTITVRPLMVMALWSEGPAPPRRLCTPARVSASLTP